MSLTLRCACDPFEIIRPLWEGTIVPAGFTLDFAEEMTNPVRHRAMVQDLAFDVCELNVSTYLIAKAAGVPITALPIFLYRRFRHGNIYINPNRPLQVADLAQARIGCPTLQAASNVWIQGILQDAGLNWDATTWVVERDEDMPFAIAPERRIERAPAGRSVITMLLAGEIDAVISPQTPDLVAAGDPRLARLFPDYVDRERAYFRDTGLFPIMHVTAIREDLVARRPDVVAALMDAFEAAKALTYKHFASARTIPLAWYNAQWEDDRRLFGPDPWENGLTAGNRANLETIVRYTHEQGFIKDRPALDSLFAVT